MRKHGVSPVVDGVLVGCIEPSDEEVDDGEQVWYEYHEVAHDTCAESSYGKEEIYSCHGGNESVDGYVFLWFTSPQYSQMLRPVIRANRNTIALGFRKQDTIHTTKSTPVMI